MQGKCGFKPREPRHKVLVRARMRAGGGLVEVCIRDISRRGMLIQAEAVPVRGTYIEVVRQGRPVVGRVVWAHDRRFGVSAGADIDVTAFTGEASASAAAVRRLPSDGYLTPGAPKLTAADIRNRLDRSHAVASGLQFSFMVAGCTIAAFLMVGAVYEALAPTFDRISEALAGKGDRR